MTVSTHSLVQGNGFRVEFIVIPAALLCVCVCVCAVEFIVIRLMQGIRARV